SRRRHTRSYGDWSSDVCSSDLACPQAHPYVQNAFGCAGQSSDVAATSPEGVNLDVIGYDLVNATTTDINGDGKSDFAIYNASTRSEERRVGKECRYTESSLQLI